MSERSGKRVSFQSSSPPKVAARSHQRESIRDSGVGSSSSDQASSGGRPDRRFTAQDHDDQRLNVRALQEALGEANKKVDNCKSKIRELESETSSQRKALREKELDRRQLFDRVKELEQLNDELEKQSVADRRDKEFIQSRYDELNKRHEELNRSYWALMQPGDAPMMSGGSGEPSRLSRSGSKHDKQSSKEMTNRLKERINRDHKSSSSTSTPTSKRHSRRLSTSKPYVEEMPPASSSSSRHTHYTTTTMETTRPKVTQMQPPAFAAVPRSYQTGVEYPGTPGDYVQYPLPDRRRRSS